jgi:hypothetical protein
MKFLDIVDSLRGKREREKGLSMRTYAGPTRRIDGAGELVVTVQSESEVSREV